MVDDAATLPSKLPTQWRLFAALLGAICLVLAGGYYWYLKGDYTVLYSGLRPADAAAVVAQLDAKGLPHRLRDGGTTILVPSDQADAGRLTIAGSDAATKGSVGFELFNKSDMGLTDFAQKINYQRALQGELVRTIMMMDTIETARVHLAIPERSLFRTTQSVPKAAVEVVSKIGQSLTPERVAGIQQLVASSVPDLALNDVVVLDGDGQIVSQAAQSRSIETPEAEEQTAAQDYYSARAKMALAASMPGLPFQVRTLVVQGQDAAPAVAPSASGDRTFRLRVTVLTPVALSADDRIVARNAVAAAVTLNERRGDDLVFEVDPTASSGPLVARPSVTKGPIRYEAPVPVATGLTPLANIGWWQAALFLLFGTFVWLLVRRRRAANLTSEQFDFVDRLRAQLRREEDARV